MGKYYWLKLPRDFFKRHDMRIIKAMPNGERIQNILVRLMAESIDHEGCLRYSDELPYDEAMLAAVIETDVESMKEAISTLTKFGLVEILEDGTFFLPKVPSMIGSAENNDNANRQRRYREKQAAEKQKTDELVTEALRNVTDSVTKCNAGVTESVTDSLQKITRDRDRVRDRDRDRYKEKEKERESEGVVTPPTLSKEKRTRFVPPTVEEVRAYCEERKNGIDAQAFVDFYSMKNWLVGKNKMADWRAAVRTWETRRKQEKANAPRRVEDLPIMENEYSKEHMEQGERDSLSLLDELLEE